MLSQPVLRDRCADAAEGLATQAGESVGMWRLVSERKARGKPHHRSTAAGTIATGASMCFRLYNQMPPHDAAALLEQREP